MEKFLNLDVWWKAKKLVYLIYEITKEFPDEEKYCLVSQMRRATISVMANIAEGCKKKSLKEKKHFYEISDTSLEEVKSYLYLCYDLKYITQKQGEEVIKLAREVGGMLNNLTKNIIY
jgi:four helix bundle protein